MKLYHFTSFSTFIKIWHTKSLLFQPYNNVNDCLERSKFVKVQDFSDESMNKLNELDNQLATFKQISLFKITQSTLKSEFNSKAPNINCYALRPYQ